MNYTKYQNLYQFTFLKHTLAVNAYLYEAPDQLIVVDMGSKTFVAPIKKLVEQLNKPLNYLLLTHGHGDHVNGVAAFKAAFPKTQVGISQREARILAGDLTLDLTEAPGKIKGSLPKQPLPLDFTFSEGETIGGLKIIATPGHTPGSVSFIDEAGSLIAGDALQTRGGVAVAGDTRWRFPFPTLGTWDKRTALKSAEQLVALEPKVLAIGHGLMLVDPVPEIQRVIKRGWGND